MINFFSSLKKGTLVDLGAGQGRDSLPLAKIGFNVTAVDISEVGLKQIQEKDSTINIVKSDLYDFDISRFDYILLDSIIHFYKNDVEKESGLINKILNEMKSGAILVNCMLRNEKAEIILKEIVEKNNIEIIKEEYVEYKEFNSIYHMLAIIKK